MKKIRDNNEKNPAFELIGFISDTLDLMIISDDMREKIKYSNEIENEMFKYFGYTITSK